MSAELTVQPLPSAPRVARRWIAGQLAQRERAELMDAAVLGVSELVTNAVLHVRSTVTVRVVDTDPRLRIEVYDDASRVPQGHPVLIAAGASSPSTIGRGLQIVDSISHAWGVSYESVGKCVWFQPAPDALSSRGVRENPTTTLDSSHPPERPVVAPHDQPLVPIRLVGLPAALFLYCRTRFLDLRREMALIALASEHHDSTAHRFIYLTLEIERSQHFVVPPLRQVASGLERGLDRVTVSFELPRALLGGLNEFRVLMAESNGYCRRRQLLTLEAGEQELAMREWYLGEMERQLRGGAPIAWPGGVHVADAQTQSFRP